MSGKAYNREELFSYEDHKKFKDDASEAAFLLGGIGTGNVSIGSRGEFRDWEIFNSPGKGNQLPYTFFSIWTRSEGEESVARVLEAKIKPPYSKSHGFGSNEVAGLPRMVSSTLIGKYPFVRVDFEDEGLPVKVQQESFTPFIPLNADDSGIPGAIIRYKVKNRTKKSVDVSIVGSLANAVGFDNADAFNYMKLVSEVKNEYKEEEDIKGLYYTSPGLESDDLKYGNMAIMTSEQNITVKPNWLEGGWWDGVQDFWDDFCDDGKVEKESVLRSVGSQLDNKRNVKIGSLGSYHTLKSGEEKVFEFILTWNFPNRIKGWTKESCCGDKESCCDNEIPIEKNYYSTLWSDAWEVGKYILKNKTRLEGSSKDFQRALFSSTLPEYVIDALASNITVIRSTTCFRIEDGTFLGWEGCFDQQGCCEGSCTHVWNYAQTLAFLFPKLEQTMRLVEFNLETDEDGKMTFRTRKVFGQEQWEMLPATDGQMGTIIRLYRDWKISGNSLLLKKVWEKASKALDFAFDYWDSDGDFVLDSQQHNTYDIEFYGPNSLTNSMFFAALKAGVEMAEYMGDQEHIEKYQEALTKGSKKMDELLWGGEYYIQKIDDVDQYKYQYGKGCLSDQVLGQLMAHVAGLGYILPKDHIRESVYSIFKYNFRTSFKDHHSVQRTYALNDEKGLVLCSWPEGGRPKLPFVYSDEVWTGIEYQVAAHLIYEDHLEEGLTIVKAVRERHDGYRRNPWNEVECGHHYARSMASWALLTALTGYEYNLVAGTMSFSPKVNQDNFSTFWSNGKAWGIYKQKIDSESGERSWEMEVLYGDIDEIKVNNES